MKETSTCDQVFPVRNMSVELCPPKGPKKSQPPDNDSYMSSPSKETRAPQRNDFRSEAGKTPSGPRTNFCARKQWCIQTTRALAKGHRSQSEGDNMSIQGTTMIIDGDALNTYRPKSPQ